MSELLDKLNEFTRREHTEDEVYIFDLVLCDNDIDRDGECFSSSALETLQKLFIGKTGIFDHDTKGANQTARIFSTELITDNSKKTKYGAVYTYLKACAYMIKTASNADLIKEIDGGIKKEVSISCSCSSQNCSICGANKKKKSCGHIKGKSYGGKPCYVILDDVTDAYEWSFVAVPAQVNAGVTKRYGDFSDDNASIKAMQNQLDEKDKIIGIIADDLKADITKLSFLTKSNSLSTILSTIVEKLDIEEMIKLKKSLEMEYKGKTQRQLVKAYDDNNSSFKL